MQVITCSLRL